MEKDQASEWAKAQNLAISVDLVTAAKHQLRFLAEVDRNRSLYDGPVLDRAIYRYKYCWLPLLAMHTESTVSEGPLVVPFDCEWIWHCHRLNPVRYKADCEDLYGRILDNRNVISSTRTTCRKQTEEIWKRMYPYEPYELNLSTHFPENVENFQKTSKKSTDYDLISAVKRQSPFFYQVSRSHMNDDIFLEEAVVRYKGFLHLIKRNWEISLRCFCVPTYDIDLIWHAHQLHPVSYCKDLVAALGKLLEHDDTDSDRTKGKKLDSGFYRTTKQWEETYGSRYWRAGAMYRGNAPSPFAIGLSRLSNLREKMAPSKDNQGMIPLHRKMVMEIMLEIVGVKDLPQGHKGRLFVTISKKQPDTFFNNKRSLSILSETKEKQVTVFQCEPRGDLVFELISYAPSALPISRPVKKLGTTSISLKDLVNPVSQLYIEKWFDLVSDSALADLKPISLRIAFSFTPPIPAPYMLHMVQTCFPLIAGMFQHFKYSYFTDEAGNDVISLHMRDSVKDEASNDYQSRKEVIGITSSGEAHVLAESAGTGWLLNNSHWWFHVHKKLNEDDHAFGFKGNRKVIVFRGTKLGYEINNGKKQKKEQHFMTAVEFSMEDPCGKAVASLNFKSGIIEICEEESLVLPMIVLAFLLSESSSNCGKSCNNEEKSANQLCTMDKVRNVNEVAAEGALCRGCVDVKGWAAVGAVEEVARVVKTSTYGRVKVCDSEVEAITVGSKDSPYGGSCGSKCDREDLVKSSPCGGCGGCGGSCGGSCGGHCSGGGAMCRN